MISKDILWKGIIEDLFEDFLLFFYSDKVHEIDFDKGFEFLDKELGGVLKVCFKQPRHQKICRV